MAGVVIFSGGTAFRETARELARRQRAIRYIITTFDSGGSSQALRQAFAMPAVGDLRNRLLAIAQDEAAARVLNLRLSADNDQAVTELKNINLSRLLAEVPEPARHAVASDLETVIAALPADFRAARASVGNLAIVGAWLGNGRNLLAAVRRYGGLLRCVGEVLPICDSDLQLAARLKNGQVARQQHLFASLPAPVAEIFLTNERGEPVRPQAEPDVLAAIGQARLVFYPMGSFYSSILANLLPAGVAQALAASPARKVFIPNVGSDAEARGLTILEQAEIIMDTLAREAGTRGNLLHLALADPLGAYPGGVPESLFRELGALGVRLLPASIVTSEGTQHAPARLAEAIEGLLAGA